MQPTHTLHTKDSWYSDQTGGGRKYWPVSTMYRLLTPSFMSKCPKLRPINTKEAIATKLREYADKHKLGVTAFAEKLGVKPGSASRLLRGEHNFTFVMVQKIITHLGIQIDYLEQEED